MTLVRLQKFLSMAGVCSRREGERLMAAGRVQVNAETVTRLGAQVDPERDRVRVDGRPVALETTHVYVLLNKPKGYVTTCHQPGEKVVTDLVDLPQRVYPVGRLDKDSTGLLLLTNDGRLHHRLSHPGFDHEKEYEVSVERPIPEGALRHMAKGMPLMGIRTREAQVVRCAARRFRITLKEGRNRQIRRMVRKVGHQVTDLKRIRLSNLTLGKLPEGSWRHLSASEKQRLLKEL
jgi:pseudouridine synthase